MAKIQTLVTNKMEQDQAVYLQEWHALKSMTTRAERNSTLLVKFHGLQMKSEEQMSSYEKGDN